MPGLAPRVGEEGPDLGDGRRLEQVLDGPHGVDPAEADVVGPLLGAAPERVGDAGQPDLQGQDVVVGPRGGQDGRRLPDS